MVKSIYPVQDFLAKTAKELEAMEEQVPLGACSVVLAFIDLIFKNYLDSTDSTFGIYHTILCNLTSIHQERQLLSTKHSLEAKSAS